MTRIGVVTVGRSDFGILRPLLRAILAEPTLELHLIVTGAHLSPRYGMGVTLIEAEGFPIADRIEMLLPSDTAEAIATSIGMGVKGFAQSLSTRRPDILVIMGDRFEMLAAAVAAAPLNIPVAHLHGGERSEGAIDELFRHAITKLSHLHFASTTEYAQRIIRMGEEPWRVTVSGAPGLDNLDTVPRATRAELESQLGLALDRPPLLVTYHPVTLQRDTARRHIAELLGGIGGYTGPIVITYPNADTEHRAIIEAIEAFAAGRADVRAVQELGTARYFGLMTLAAAMVGNSSSGIIEAASFHLPVVNVGDRQRGRIRAANVIDAPCERGAIAAALATAVAPDFRASLTSLQNPYGDGHAAPRIVEVLRQIAVTPTLLDKRFFDGAPGATLERPV
jgi:UDP-hydrolysing UDP-N-acetyl-D-glucosamine 2-epimerase